MTTKILHSIINLVEYLTLAIFIILVSAIATSKAKDIQPPLDESTLNGLFTPTEAQRFFEAGRKDFEQEVEIIAHPERYLTDDLLQIDDRLIEEMRETKPFYDFSQDIF